MSRLDARVPIICGTFNLNIIIEKLFDRSQTAEKSLSVQGPRTPCHMGRDYSAPLPMGRSLLSCPPKLYPHLRVSDSKTLVNPLLIFYNSQKLSCLVGVANRPDTCPVSSAHLNDFLRRFFAIISSVAADSQRRLGQLVAHRRQRALDEVFSVVRLHEHFGRLAQPARARLHPVEHLRRHGHCRQSHRPTFVNRRTTLQSADSRTPNDVTTSLTVTHAATLTPTTNTPSANAKGQHRTRRSRSTYSLRMAHDYS